MFSTMFSRKAASRLLVRAFNTGGSKGYISRGIPSRFRSSPPRWLGTQVVAQVDEDLDAALDSLLGSAKDEAEDPRDLESEAHMKDSHPIPPNLLEEVSSVCPVLSRWVDPSSSTCFKKLAIHT